MGISLVIQISKFMLLCAWEREIKLNLSNICFDTRELKFKSEKSGRLDSLLIPIPLFKQTVKFRAHKGIFMYFLAPHQKAIGLISG